MHKKKKRLGQHFLRHREILEKIVAAAEINREDKVIEIGPGLGDLTELLIERARQVVALEIDASLCNILRERFADRKNLLIIHEDALKFPYEKQKEFKVVSNIPYYITKPLIFRLIEASNLKSMTLTLQKEVAERLTAKPHSKAYSALTLIFQYQMEADIKFHIPSSFFCPPPKVDSSVIKMDRRQRPPVEVLNENLFFKLIKTAFSHRRKMLSNSLKSFIDNPKSFLLSLGIDPNKRAEELTIQEYANMTNELCKICKV